MLKHMMVALLLLIAPLTAQASDINADFTRWLEEVIWPLSSRQGVSRQGFDAATAGLTLDRDLPDLILPGSKSPTPTGAFQAEFSGPANYLADKKIAAIVSGGQKQGKSWKKALSAAEAETGVPASIILAIWGRESGFGSADIPKDGLRTLATQAFMGSRKELFVPELVAALVMIDRYGLTRKEMKSSWAGALGQPQFLPSKYLLHARDADGDGHADIWGSVPDVVLSIAHYLKENGWQPGINWGVEVMIPPGVSCTAEGPDKAYSLDTLVEAGVTRIDGSALTAREAGDRLHILMPAGRYGPAFVVSENFYILKTYNESDLYALFVGSSATRINGGPKIAGTWSKLDKFTRGEARDMQLALEKLGYDVGGADGLIGWRTRISIGDWQEKNGMTATCFPDRDVLDKLR